MSGDEVRIGAVLDEHHTWTSTQIDGRHREWTCIPCGHGGVLQAGDLATDAHRAHVAAALVAAGVGDVAAAKAEAWDEGWATGMGDAAGLSNGTADRVTDNPYEAPDA